MDATPSPGKGMAIAAMVLGILAFVPGCCFLYIGAVLAIIAIVLGVKAKGGPGGAMATTGMILGICALLLYVVALITGTQLNDKLTTWAEEMEAVQQQQEEVEGGSGDDSAE